MQFVEETIGQKVYLLRYFAPRLLLLLVLSLLTSEEGVIPFGSDSIEVPANSPFIASNVNLKSVFHRLNYKFCRQLNRVFRLRT